jgi:O-antigen/teichoic acid export membrane protein
LKNIYLKSVTAIGLLSFPLLSGMIACGYYIISGLYGKNWEGSVTVFKILAVSAFFKVISNIGGAVTKATGNVYNEVWRQFIYSLILGSGVLIGVRFGIEGVGYAAIAASAWLFFSLNHLINKILSLSGKEIYKALLPGLIISVIILASDLSAILLLESFFHPLSNTLKLFILVLISGITILLCFTYLPERIKGGIPAWIFNRYKNLIYVNLLKRADQSVSAGA